MVLLSLGYLAFTYLTFLLAALIPGAIYSWLGKMAAGLPLLFLLVAYPGLLLSMSKPGVILGGAMMVSITLTCFFTANDFLMGATYYRFLVLPGVFCIFSTTAANEKNLRRLLLGFAILAAINCSIGIWGSVTHSSLFQGVDLEKIQRGSMGYDERTGRSGGLRGENSSGMMAAPALAFGLVGLLRKRLGLTQIAFIGVGLLGVAVSLSRTSAISAAGVLLWWMLASRLRKVRFGKVALAIILLVMAAYGIKFILTIQSKGMNSLIVRTQEERWNGSGDVFSGRLGIWARDLALAMEKPVFGHGPLASILLTGICAHNAFLDMLMDFGLLGLGIFLVPTIWLFKNLIFKAQPYCQ